MYCDGGSTHNSRYIQIQPTPTEDLVRAAETGDLQLAEEAIRRRADVNASGNDGVRPHPLHYAAHNNHLDIAQLLIEAGANVNARDRAGGTPLQSAAGSGHLGMVQLLIASGADVYVRDAMGRTAEDLALANNHRELDKLLAPGRLTKPARRRMPA
jgi:ankyrin repeat protein